MVGYLKGYCSEMAGVWLYGRRRNKDLLLEHGDSSSLGRWVTVGGFRGSKLRAECCAHSLPVLFNFLEIWGRQRPSIFQIKHLLKWIYLPFNCFYLLACSFKIFRISLGVEGYECRGIRDANANSRHLQTSTVLAHRIQIEVFTCRHMLKFISYSAVFIEFLCL